MSTLTTFYFNIDGILDKVENNALFRARNITKDRTPDFAELSIVDARDFLKDQLKTIASKIFDTELSQYTYGLDDLEIAVEAYQFDVTYDSVAGRIVYNAVFPAIWNHKLVPAVSNAIEDAMIKYLVCEWLKKGNYDYRQDEVDFGKAMDDLRSLVARRKNLKRTYKLY